MKTHKTINRADESESKCGDFEHAKRYYEVEQRILQHLKGRSSVLMMSDSVVVQFASNGEF